MKILLYATNEGLVLDLVGKIAEELMVVMSRSAALLKI